MNRTLVSACILLAASTGACAPTTQSSASGAPADRVLITDVNGQVIRQSALDDRSMVSFAAPVATVWTALISAYADVGIEANFADRDNNRYGVRNYTVPKVLHGERIGSLFGCGSSVSGALVDNATLTGDIVTTLLPAADGTTRASIYVSAWARRNDGTSSNPVVCESTGKIEELLRTTIQQKLAASRTP